MNRHWKFQLKDLATGEAIITAGGACHVAVAGSPDKQALVDKDGAALANPVTPTRGSIEFYIADETVLTVDLYVMAPGGQFVVREGVSASGPNEIGVDAAKKEQVAKIPFSIADATTDVETDTGFDLPDLAIVLNRLHGCGILVDTLQAGDTIDVGLGEAVPAETGGDADGFINGSSLAAETLVIGTDGALFSTNAPHMSDAVAAKSITYTLIGTVTLAKGFILLPYRLI